MSKFQEQEKMVKQQNIKDFKIINELVNKK
jgi:hypothetical protein